MTLDDFLERTEPIRNQAKRDDDSYVFCYFSREQDKYIGEHRMDAGDALIVISKLIQDFNLDPEIVAAMDP